MAQMQMINRDKPDRWKEDVARSVDMYNEWFFASAPAAFRESRIKATQNVAAALKWTRNLTNIESGLLLQHPEILPILRMSTCPPIARDRLIGLGGVLPNVVKCMDSKHCLPPRMKRDVLDEQIDRIIATVARLLGRL